MLETKGDVLFPPDMRLGTAEMPVGSGEHQPLRPRGQSGGPLAQRMLLGSAAHRSKMAGEGPTCLPGTFGGSLRHLGFKGCSISNLA